MSRQFALGCAFRTCENFWESTDFSLVLSQKFSQDTKLPPQFLPLKFCAFVQNLVKNKSKKPLKSFCYFLLSQKVESPLPSNFNLPNKADFTNPTQQTIEGIAVEVVEFLPNLGRETRLGVCERPKFGKSTQDAPKRELQKEIAYDS